MTRHRPRDVFQEQQRRPAGVVGIVEDHQQRPGLAHLAQELCHGVEGPEPGLVGQFVVHGGHRTGEHVGCQAGQVRHQSSPQGDRGQVDLVLDRAQDLAPRPVRRSPRRLRSLAPRGGEAARRRRLHQLLGQPGLADARLATAEDESWPAGLRGTQTVSEQSPLVPSTDHLAPHRRASTGSNRRDRRRRIRAHPVQVIRSPGESSSSVRYPVYSRRIRSVRTGPTRTAGDFPACRAARSDAGPSAWTSSYSDALTASLTHLLVEQHPDQQRERIAAEQLVGRRVLGDRQIRHPRAPALRSDCGQLSAARWHGGRAGHRSVVPVGEIMERRSAGSRPPADTPSGTRTAPAAFTCRGALPAPPTASKRDMSTDHSPRAAHPQPREGARSR